MLVLGIAQFEFEFAFLGPEHNRLAVHAPDHVEGGAGLTAQRQLQEVVLDARFNGFAQLGLDFEETVRRAQPLDALMRPLVVVIFDPEFDPFPGLLEAVELGPREKLLPETFPEPFDLAQGHGMMRTALEVGHAILLELDFETAGPAPGGVLTPIVGQHLLGRLILAHRHPVDFDDGLGGGAAEQIGPHHEPGVIVQETDQISVTASQPEGEDVALPHLIGRGPLEEPGPGQIALFGRRALRHQLRLLQALAHALRTGRQ